MSYQLQTQVFCLNTLSALNDLTCDSDTHADCLKGRRSTKTFFCSFQKHLKDFWLILWGNIMGNPFHVDLQSLLWQFWLDKIKKQKHGKIGIMWGNIFKHNNQARLQTGFILLCQNIFPQLQKHFSVLAMTFLWPIFLFVMSLVMWFCVCILFRT